MKIYVVDVAELVGKAVVSVTKYAGVDYTEAKRIAWAYRAHENNVMAAIQTWTDGQIEKVAYIDRNGKEE